MQTLTEQLIFNLESSWENALLDELKKSYIKSLISFVNQERQSHTVYPANENVFNALNLSPFDQVKVVIVGQDPYHGPGQAHGLSFSVPYGIPKPPSLKNIFKELESDLGIKMPSHGCLNSWAEQGVLLLNAILTVRKNEPMSHQGRGWELFTDAIIEKLANKKDPLIFVLWGKHAMKKEGFFKNFSQHTVLTAPHPSPFSAHTGFFGCRHFSKINALLLSKNLQPINWELEEIDSTLDLFTHL
jgi:uracil-DNA glycosylase